MIKIIIERGGETRAIYSDQLLPYIAAVQAEFGLPEDSLRINRASNVEPDPERKAGGNWFVDLTPMGGPVCYVDEEENPFLMRQSAIDFELRWLDTHWLEKETQDAGIVTEEK